MFLTIEVSKEEGHYKAYCVELDVAASGVTSEKAIAKLKKIIDFYLSTANESDAHAEVIHDSEQSFSSSLFN